ncbi:MAG: glycosyltransferase family 9 protein [Gemmataceae bacterium]
MKWPPKIPHSLPGFGSDRPEPKPPLSEWPAKRIALIKPSALGDIVHSLPVLSALRHRYPQARIVWIVNKGYQSLIEGHPELDATIPFDRTVTGDGLWAATKSYATFIRKLRAEKFDLAIDLQGLMRSGVMCYLTGAKRRVGLATAREYSRWFYTDVVGRLSSEPETKNREQKTGNRKPTFNSSAAGSFQSSVGYLDTLHAVDRYWEVALTLGARDYPITFRLPIHTEALEWAREALGSLPRPWMMVGIGARWETKRLPPEFFARLLGRAQEQYGGTAIFVGRDDETTLAQAAADQLKGPTRTFTGETSLPELAALLSLADVMLANDSGPLHLAVALGRDVVAPYTCTRPSQHGPYRQENRTTTTRVSCAGSYLRRCARLECLSELHPDRLWPQLQEILTTWQKQQGRTEKEVLTTTSRSKTETKTQVEVGTNNNPAFH